LPASRFWRKSAPRRATDHAQDRTSPEGGTILHWLATVFFIGVTIPYQNLSNAIAFSGNLLVYGHFVVEGRHMSTNTMLVQVFADRTYSCCWHWIHIPIQTEDKKHDCSGRLQSASTAQLASTYEGASDRSLAPRSAANRFQYRRYCMLSHTACGTHLSLRHRCRAGRSNSVLASHRIWREAKRWTWLRVQSARC
jgi:hypothetical protein